MIQYKALYCLGLMYWYFEAENDEEAEVIAEQHFREIQSTIADKFDTTLNYSGVGIVQEVHPK